MSVEDLSSEELTMRLTYAGLVRIGFELIKNMIVGPIKLFYADTTWDESCPFKSYDEDVRIRHTNEFESCLLYLRDFMGAIDSTDVTTIQELRKHRNELAHDLVNTIPRLQVSKYRSLWGRVGRTLFKLSNYRTYIEIGSDPEFRWINNWDAVKGSEYLLFEDVMERVGVFRSQVV